MDYSAEVRRRFVAALRQPDSAAGDGAPEFAGEAEDRALGVWARARISVLGGRIVAAAIDVFGCPDTIAAAKYVEERLRGIAPEEFRGFDALGAARTLGIPTEKLGKVLRLEDAVLAAIEAAQAQPDREGDYGDITD